MERNIDNQDFDLDLFNNIILNINIIFFRYEYKYRYK
jgi:hypothetical protein